MTRFTLGVGLTLALGVAGAALGAQLAEGITLHYRTTDEDTGTVVDRSTVTITRGDSTAWVVEWRSEVTPDKTEDMWLDSTLATTSWRVRFAEDGYDYVGRRVGDVLRIEGVLDGETMTKDVEIDGHPFYYNWQVGLIDFVRSGDEKRKFWTFRPDNQGAYAFEAQRKEDAVVTMNGQDVPVTRIEWGLSGWRRTFYKGSQWHRTEDGYFVMGSRDDRLMELVGTAAVPGG